MLSDRDKLQAFRRGERAVLEELYRHYAPEIARMARNGFCFGSRGQTLRFNGLASPSEQLNLVQETFARAFSAEARRRFDGLHPFGAYLHGIARNLVVDQLRSAQVEVLAEEPALLEGQVDPLAEPQLLPDASLRRDAVIKTVRELVTGLSLEERRLVELRFEQGLKQEEAARRMKTGRSRIRTLEGRVREKLARALRQAGLLNGDGGGP